MEKFTGKRTGWLHVLLKEFFFPKNKITHVKQYFKSECHWKDWYRKILNNMANRH